MWVTAGIKDCLLCCMTRTWLLMRRLELVRHASSKDKPRESQKNRKFSLAAAWMTHDKRMCAEDSIGMAAASASSGDVQVHSCMTFVTWLQTIMRTACNRHTMRTA